MKALSLYAVSPSKHWMVALFGTLGMLLLLALASPSLAQDQAQQTSEDKTGLAVGAKAPAFNLKDQQGQEHSLADLLQKGKVVVVFHRSADW